MIAHYFRHFEEVLPVTVRYFLCCTTQHKTQRPKDPRTQRPNEPKTQDPKTPRTQDQDSRPQHKTKPKTKTTKTTTKTKNKTKTIRRPRPRLRLRLKSYQETLDQDKSETRTEAETESETEMETIDTSDAFVSTKRHNRVSVFSLVATKIASSLKKALFWALARRSLCPG
jgi:hypothetical protein